MVAVSRESKGKKNKKKKKKKKEGANPESNRGPLST